MDVGWGGEGGMVGNIGLIASQLSQLTRYHRPQKVNLQRKLLESMFRLKGARQSFILFFRIETSLCLGDSNNQISLHFCVPDNKIPLRFEIPNNQISLQFDVPKLNHQLLCYTPIIHTVN